MLENNNPVQSTVKFYQNPIIWMKLKSKELKEKEEARNSISQDEYFATQLQWLSQTTEKVRMFGYDQPFMELDDTILQIENAIAGKGNHRYGQPVYITAIIPQNVKNTKLEELANQSAFLTILRHSKDIPKGTIIYDAFGFNMWDTTKETAYPPEKGKGIIYRTSVLGNQFATDKLIEQYAGLEATLRRNTKS